MCLAKGQNAVTPVKLEPAAPWSPIKHSTIEPLQSLLTKYVCLPNIIEVSQRPQKLWSELKVSALKFIQMLKDARERVTVTQYILKQKGKFAFHGPLSFDPFKTKEQK